MPTTLCPGRLVFHAASMVDRARESETPAHLVARCVRGVSTAGESIAQVSHATAAARWSAAFVHDAGYWTHFDVRAWASRWPLPSEGSCDALAEFAKRRGIVARDMPRLGDIYLLWSPARKRYTRAGIIAAEPEVRRMPSGHWCFEAVTIDGDTDRDGALHGERTLITYRRLSMDRRDLIIRWVDAAPRAEQEPPRALAA